MNWRGFHDFIFEFERNSSVSFLFSDVSMCFYVFLCTCRFDIESYLLWHVFQTVPDWASEDWDLITLPIRRGDFQLQRTLKGKVLGMECSPRDARVLSYMISVSWHRFFLES